MPPRLSAGGEVGGGGDLFVKGVILGLGAAVPIRPVNVEIARRSLRGGFGAGFALGCGAVTVDVVYAILSSVGLRPLIGRPIFYWTITAAGLVLLGYLGIMSLLAARREWRGRGVGLGAGNGREDSTAGHSQARGAYFTGVAMTLLNPMTVAFWFVAVPGVIGSITDRPGHDLPIICSGVFTGTTAWVVCFAGLMGFLGRYRRRWWIAAADAVGGAVLLGFAAALFLRSVGAFLR